MSPFVGDHYENWEEFGYKKIPNGTSILGGIATISANDDNMETAKTFLMCTVYGKPIDGQTLMDSDRPTGLVTISFSQPVSAFGGYWGSGYKCYGDPPSILTFYDSSGNVVGTDSFKYVGNGTLTWHGYQFARPVKTITRIAADDEEGFAVDGLQATVATSGKLANISTRGQVLAGDSALIAGFIVSGTDQKDVIVRGIGPSIPLATALQDPVLELHDSNGTLYANDNWGDTQQQQIAATGVAPTNSAESAAVARLSANGSAYTVVVRGKDDGTGIGLAEVYDLTQSANAKLANISTRGFVGMGDAAMIGGFIIQTGNLRVIVRAIGPSLAVDGALPNPKVELYDANGAVLQVNDDWKSDQRAEIEATGVAPTNDAESAIVRDLVPGNYTAVVRGANNTNGVALVEAYALQ